MQISNSARLLTCLSAVLFLITECEGCNRHDECTGKEICCRGTCAREPVCESCRGHYDCPGKELCCKSKCLERPSCRDFCQSDSQCKTHQACRPIHASTPKFGTSCISRQCNTSLDCRTSRNSKYLVCRNGTCFQSRTGTKGRSSILEAAKMILFVMLVIFFLFCLLSFLRNCCQEFFNDPERFCRDIVRGLFSCFKTITCGILYCIFGCFKRGPLAESERNSIQDTEMNECHMNTVTHSETNSEEETFAPSEVTSSTVNYEEQFPVSFDAESRAEGMPYSNELFRQVLSFEPPSTDSTSEEPPPSYDDVMAREPPPRYEDVV